VVYSQFLFLYCARNYNCHRRISSCGKSTLAKELANKLNYVYVDSGAMYRAVTLHLINTGTLKDGHFIKKQVLDELQSIQIGFKYNSEKQKSETYLNGENVEKDIRTMTIARQVSAISAIGEVREKLVAIQQELGGNGTVVMDGRDIGTVVFPNADVKADDAVEIDNSFLTRDEQFELALEIIQKKLIAVQLSK